jgi:hypothetical protein
MSDFWKTLAGNSSSQLLTGSMDSLLSGRANGEDFEKMRVLTDTYREANALELPVEAGTKVSFIGTLGAYMAYDNPPPEGSVGEVVQVKSANGDITHNEGKVFIQWDDGEFRPVHAEHLRLASSKTASDIKQQFEKIKGMAEKKPDNDFLKSLLKQMADKGFAPTDKQMAVVKKIEKEIEQQGQMKKELGALVKKKGEFDASEIGEEKKGPIEADSDEPFMKDHFTQKDQEELTRAIKNGSQFRVASLGDLTDFLKVAEGQLIHRSTQDLWNVVADGEGFTITRLFDDNGNPLKG